MSNCVASFPGLRVSSHAIERRLQCEGATPEEIAWFMDNPGLRRYVIKVIREEYERSLEMTPEARRIYIHPGREAVRGLVRPNRYFTRDGHKLIADSRRQNGEQYYFAGNVIYVVDHGAIVTVLAPEQRNIETLFQVMPEARALEESTIEIVKSAKEWMKTHVLRVEPDNCVSEVRQLPRPRNFKREAPPVARWMQKPDDFMTILVVDDGEDATIDLRSAYARLREEMSASFTAFMEDADCLVLKALRAKATASKTLKFRDLPPLPGIVWGEVSTELPNSARKWWQDMLDAGQAQGRLVCVMTPETARAVLEIADGSSYAAWRRSSALNPGNLLRLCLAQGKLEVQFCTQD